MKNDAFISELQILIDNNGWEHSWTDSADGGYSVDIRINNELYNVEIPAHNNFERIYRVLNKDSNITILVIDTDKTEEVIAKLNELGGKA